jgi:hypothetical protein
LELFLQKVGFKEKSNHVEGQEAKNKSIEIKCQGEN